MVTDTSFSTRLRRLLVVGLSFTTVLLLTWSARVPQEARHLQEVGAVSGHRVSRGGAAISFPLESYAEAKEPGSVEQNVSIGIPYLLSPGHAGDGLRHFLGKGPEDHTVSGRLQPLVATVDVSIEQGGKVLDEWTVPVDREGCFVLPFSDYPDGAYRLVFKAPRALHEAVEVSYQGKFGLGGVDVALRMGDLNGDNRVSEAEVTFIESHVGHSVNSTDRYLARWEVDLKNGYVVGYADLNRNGIIDKEDFRVAESNLNAVGD
jgi:hypothetical protein